MWATDFTISHPGCSQRASAGSIGHRFNANGGTYAAEWDPLAGHVRVWSWKAGEEPLDVVKKEPKPNGLLGENGNILKQVETY